MSEELYGSLIEQDLEKRKWMRRAIPYLKAFKEELEEGITINLDKETSIPEQRENWELGRKEMQDQVEELTELLIQVGALEE